MLRLLRRLKMTEIVQKALHTCPDHVHQEMDMYCKTCKKPVCVKCVRNEHKDHEWDTLKNVAKLLRAQMRERKLEFDYISKSIVEGVKEVLDVVSSRLKNELSSNNSEIEQTRKRLVKFVNDEVDRMKEKFQKNYDKKARSVKNQRDKLTTKESRIDFLIQEMETGATDLTDFDWIELNDEIQQILLDLQSFCEISEDFQEKMTFTPGPLDMSNILSSLGTLEIKHSYTTQVIKHDFQISRHSLINKICPINENEAWVRAPGSPLLTLIDREGTMKKEIDMPSFFSDFAVSQNGTLFFTDQRKRMVWESDGEKREELFSTHPFVCHSLCVSRSGDIMDIVTGSADLPNDTNSIRLLVRQRLKTGVMIKECDMKIERYDPLDAYPHRLLELHNGNICVLVAYFDNRSSTYISMVYCFDITGNILFKSRIGVAEVGFCNDIEGNILLPGHFKSGISVFNRKGQRNRELLRKDMCNRRIGSFALLDNNLWVGSFSGKIQVYAYYN